MIIIIENNVESQKGLLVKEVFFFDFYYKKRL